MKVTEPKLSVEASRQPLGYAKSSPPNLQPIAEGLVSAGNKLASAFERVQAENKARAEQMNRFNAVASLADFDTNQTLKFEEFKKNSAPNDANFAERYVNSYLNDEANFINKLPPDLQPEYKVRLAQTRQRMTISAYDYQAKKNNEYYTGEIKKRAETGTAQITTDTSQLPTVKDQVFTMIDQADLPADQKASMKETYARGLEGTAYKVTVRNKRLADAEYTDQLTSAARNVSQRLGISPLDLLTAISYETGGTFSTDIKGGKGGVHIGLIQFSPEMAAKYHVTPGMSAADQMEAVSSYLYDAGVRPGMGLMEIYSAINAGAVGRNNASDAANGGMPGTVADKVTTQMGEHRAKAAKLLDGKYDIPDNIDADPNFANVPYEDRVAARADVQKEVNDFLSQSKEERKAAENNFNNDLFIGLSDGRYGQADIDAARQNGYLSDYSDLAKAQEILTKKQKDAEDTAMFQQRLANGYVLDPQDAENKKGMNLLYKQNAGEAKLNNKDESFITGVLGPDLAKYGMIPPDAVDQLAALTRSNDRTKMFYALQALQRLEEFNPKAYAAQVPEDLQKQVDRYIGLSGVMDEKTLAEHLIGPKNAEMRQTQMVLREAAIKELRDNPKINFQDDVVSALGADVVLSGDAVTGNRGIAMENEWRQLLIENYAATGDMTIARELTKKHLANLWGVSKFLGKDYLMRNPPEKYYPAINGDHAWMKRQIYEELGIPQDWEVQLLPDATTDSEVQKMQQGKLQRGPSYIVMVNKGDGIWTHLDMRDVKNIPPKGLVQAGTIDIHKRPIVNNPDGSFSTVESFSYQNSQGQEVLIPSISDEGKRMTQDEAIKYWENKGQNLGIFDTPENADAYAKKLHEDQAIEYNPWTRLGKRIFGEPPPPPQGLVRQYFQPTETDKEIEKLNSLIKNNENLAQYYRGQVLPRGARPAEIDAKLAQTNDQLRVLREQRDRLLGKSQTQWQSPAAQELAKEQPKLDELLYELDMFSGNVDDWPKKQQLLDQKAKVDELKQKADEELLQRQQEKGVQ